MGKTPYFNVKSDFARHPKIGKLKRRHGAEGVVTLQALWGYAAQWFPNGNFKDATAEEICAFCGWPGGADYVDDLVELGLLDKLETGEYSIHNWLKYQKHLK